MLAGTSRGRILTDDPLAPRWAAVQEFSGDSEVSFGGELDATRVAEVITRLRRDRTLTIGLAADDPLLAMLPPDSDEDGWDSDFEERDHALDLAPLAVPPAGLRLARIDAHLAPRCQWQPWMVRDLESAPQLGIGYCLLDGERVVAEAFAGPNVDGALEMATITAEGYQRRGLASVVCARTVLACERLGFTTWWNTSLTNHGSRGVAQRMGYRRETRYRVLAWHRAGDG